MKKISIQNKIILIFSLIAVIFWILSYILHYYETNKIKHLLEKRKEDQISFYDKIFNLEGEKLKIIVNTEYSIWNEMNYFVTSDTLDKKFATENIDFLIKNYDFNAVWVYKPDFTLFYSVARLDNELIKNEFPTKEILEKVFQESQTTHFFMKTSYGFMEVRGAGIQLAKDDTRKAIPKGYFFASKLLDQNYFSQLNELTNSETELVSKVNETEETLDLEKSLIIFEKPIKDWKNETLASLKVTSKLSPVTYELTSVKGQNLYYYLLSTLISIVIASFLLIYLIFKPLRLIFQVLNSGDIKLINELSEKDNEFGRLNSLIKKFFAQREELLQEISQRKKTENDLRESQKRYKTIVEVQTELICRYSPKDGKLTFVNEAYCHYFSKKAEELIGNTCFELVFEEDREKIRTVAKNLNEQNPVISYEQRVLLNGEIRWQFWIDKAIFNENNEIIEIQAVGRDVTKQKIAEQLIFEEKERLSVTLKSIGDGVITTDTKGNVLSINQVGEKMTCWTSEEAAGKPLSEVFKIINESSKKTIINPVEEVLRTGKIVELANHTILVAKDGTEKIIADSAAPIKNKNGQVIGVVLVFRDVTEKKRMEDEILRGKKLESLGTLAGGIAHDFNNMLAGILGNISIIKLMIPYDEKISKRLEDAEKATERAKSLTQQLLTFSKGGTPIKKITSLDKLVRESVEFALSGSNVTKKILIDEGLWPAEIDAGQIDQVLSNLVINATQSMPDGGKIEITCENTIVTSESALPVENGNYIKISIKDQGIGIPFENQSKIFDPYFTTKQKGHGLGLATTYSIIQKHNGCINFQSELGVGTTFFIHLPASQPGEPVENNDFNLEIQKSFGKKILVMDDDEQVLEVIASMLELSGYEVQKAKDGLITLKLYQKAQTENKPFDLVIMDLTIPGGMGGKETIYKLLEIDKNAKVIVSSGYSNDPVLSNYKLYGFSGIILKPFDFAELTAAVKGIFEA